MNEQDGVRLLALERIARYPWDDPNSNDAVIVKQLATDALRAAPVPRRDAEPVEANLRQRQLEHGKKRPEQNNPDGYPDEIPATPAGEEVRRTAIEECAKIAQSAREDDLDYAIKYPDERRKMEERAHRAGTIETAIRALSPSSNGKPATENYETCPTCLGSSYSNHPDSGEICRTCGGCGGVNPLTPDANSLAKNKNAKL